MIVGIGCDLVEIERIRQVLERQPALPQRILTATEREKAAQRYDAAVYLATRFAAKEAVAKALGSGIGSGVTFQDIEILNDESGMPQISLGGGARQLARRRGVSRMHISLSDTDLHAMAYVVLEGDQPRTEATSLQ